MYYPHFSRCPAKMRLHQRQRAEAEERRGFAAGFVKSAAESVRRGTKVRAGLAIPARARALPGHFLCTSRSMKRLDAGSNLGSSDSHKGHEKRIKTRRTRGDR